MVEIVRLDNVGPSPLPHNIIHSGAHDQHELLSFITIYGKDKAFLKYGV